MGVCLPLASNALDLASGLRNVNVLRWFDVSGIRIKLVAPTRACAQSQSLPVLIIDDALLPDLCGFSRAYTLDRQMQGHE